MTFSWKLGRVAGIDLFLHPTFLILMLFVGLGSGGVPAMLLLLAVFGCVLLHELGHAMAARLYGIRTEDITLYPIGGVARLARMPRKPGPELLIALAGPAVNLAIAAVLAVGLVVLGGISGGTDAIVGGGFVPQFLASLLSINLLLAAFNLLPAFPMDGGRVVRALLSGWLGRMRATDIAAGIGQVLAAAFGVWCLLNGQFLQVALAAFIYMAAGAERARVQEEEEGRGGHRRDDGGPRGGVWVAPSGQRWVRGVGGGWRLAPVVVTVDGRSTRWDGRTWN